VLAGSLPEDFEEQRQQRVLSDQTEKALANANKHNDNNQETSDDSDDQY
jgi:hypothetical protein